MLFDVSDYYWAKRDGWIVKELASQSDFITTGGRFHDFL